MTASELARLVGGTLAGPDRSFSGVGPLERAGPTEAAYAVGQVPDDCGAAVLIVREAVPRRSCVVVADPKAAFCKLLGELFPEHDGFVVKPRGLPRNPSDPTWVESSVHPSAHVDPSARVGLGVVIHPGCYVGAFCEIGDGTVLFPHVVLYPGTAVGSNCRIHAGAVLGADGFSYEPGPQGPVKVPQVGRVIVEDDVEIGPNTVIDRAFLEQTRIGRGVKIDALVMVGHNCVVRQGTVIAAQAGLAGSVDVGPGSQLGGQAGVSDHTTLGAGVRVGAQAGVGRDLPAGAAVLSLPGLPARVARKVWAQWIRLGKDPG
ncbi:MAG: UDP-3-O-(3-hydroxymyristoyl)glucosamine N-acyltransferase [Alphaproteobacteria bacterium]|nr:UDP-3-O-(3-hydroxymyristoyl)glucosamine N-acyltransferase [Alphaproteobacteria bacterium]